MYADPARRRYRTKWGSSRLEAYGRHGTEGKKKDRNEWRDLRHKAVQRSKPEPWCVIDSRIRKIYPTGDRKIYPKGDPQGVSTRFRAFFFHVPHMSCIRPVDMTP